MENQYDVSGTLPLATQPLCLFDHFKVGFSGIITGLAWVDLEAFRHRLHLAGVLNRKRSRRNPKCIVLDVPITSTHGELIGGLAVELHVELISDDTIQITSRSSMSANLVEPLRNLLPLQTTEASLDGKSNFLGETAAQDVAALNLQFTFVDVAIETACEHIRNALPATAEPRDVMAWVREAELHHDVHSDKALQVARAVCHTALGGMRLGDHDSYRSGTSRDRVPVAHWRATRTGEIVKVYPKAANLVRAEVRCGNRESVYKCCGERKTAPLSGEDVARLLYAFYEKAAPTVALAVKHVERTAAGSRSVAECINALDPLFRMARRERAESGYTPSAAAALSAQRTVDELLCAGLCRLRGHRAGTKLREVLDRMTEHDGPLTKGAQGTIYCLKPEFGRAAAKLAEKSVEICDAHATTDNFQTRKEG